MKHSLKLSTALPIVLLAGGAFAQNVTDKSTVVIHSNNDASNHDEPIILREGNTDVMLVGNTNGVIVNLATDLNSTLNVDGYATMSNATISGDLLLQGSLNTPDGNALDLVARSGGNGSNAVMNLTAIGGNNGEDSAITISASGSASNDINLIADGSNGTINMRAGSNTTTLDLTDSALSGTTSGVITFTANGSDPVSDQSFAVLANEDIDFTSTNDDILMGAGDDIQMRAANNITMTSLNNDVEIDAADDIEMNASQDFELTKQLGEDSSGNFYGSGIIALQGSNANRYVADDNGKIVLVDESTAWSTEFDGNEIETSASNVAAGTSAQLLVGDTAGNMRGLVVQENKTTLSGGQNAASLSLHANGATFSNPTDGRPIQVHGVADGSAPFDAVNVRQLYSGLAAVMAAGTPELRLEPGKTSAAIGVGHYGGYSGVGFGLGHMYDNGTVVTMSVGKAKHSEPAIKGSVSWTW